MNDTNTPQLNNTQDGAEPWCLRLIVVHILTLCRPHILLKLSEAHGQKVRVLRGKAVDLELGAWAQVQHHPGPRALLTAV